MSSDEAQAYHSAQVETFASTNADLVSALTLNYADEATGIARAAVEARIPSVISFTVETDGRLPSGQDLREAVAEVDDATGAAPAYYMINCAHPTHFEDVLGGGGLERVAGLRANASMKSHAELDEAEELDQGDPEDLAECYRALKPLLPGLNVVGGCCGTDERHIEAICAAWTR
jgi:S-methylmethionine-dependent homocysteine/selenocysteine methylase